MAYSQVFNDGLLVSVHPEIVIYSLYFSCRSVFKPTIRAFSCFPCRVKTRLTEIAFFNDLSYYPFYWQWNYRIWLLSLRHWTPAIGIIAQWQYRKVFPSSFQMTPLDCAFFVNHIHTKPNYRVGPQEGQLVVAQEHQLSSSTWGVMSHRILAASAPKYF